MPNMTDIPTVSLAIQQAVAPVFLLTGIGSILGVLTNRLGRAIDRNRRLNEMTAERVGNSHAQEVSNLAKRTRWIRRAISLCTLSALCVCLSIASLFVAVQLQFDLSGAVSLLFIAAMLALIAGLLCFLREIALATRST
ncbi:DUF2721 domain-containing protein [Methylomonas methanica]|uniref:DUF2721 domain-containing protein n=1 Tax=Methylomonas methanica (strain DSM 25384 / MC09) TaxID=857087 RepID=F9ZVM7_METMM|nr:DUF2721 domain-containing protein [Methylomonas methanica]AEF99505.1 hypothetical protein Metme_1071 [Methylomonas methanica MC09]